MEPNSCPGSNKMTRSDAVGCHNEGDKPMKACVKSVIPQATRLLLTIVCCLCLAAQSSETKQMNVTATTTNKQESNEMESRQVRSSNSTKSQNMTSLYPKQQSDYELLLAKFAHDPLGRNNLISLLSVVNDSRGVQEQTRKRIYDLIDRTKAPTSDANSESQQQQQQQRKLMKNAEGNEQKLRKIVFDDTIFLKRALREIEGKMNMSFEGESKSDPSIHWMVLYNETTILVVRSANKYYYWTYGQTAGALIIFCFIVVGNLSILHRLKSHRRRRSNVNYFIVQLAIADLLVGIFSVTLDSVLRIQKAFTWGLFACRTSKYISVLFIYSSTNLLVALSIDRWEAVVKPLAFTRNRSRGYQLVAISWILALICALPVTFFTKIKEIDGLPQCWIDLNNFGWRIYLIYLTSLLLILPTLIIAICYAQIVYTIWSKARIVVDQQEQRIRQQQQQQQYHKQMLNKQQHNLIVGQSKSTTREIKLNPLINRSNRRSCLKASSLKSNDRGRFERSKTIDVGLPPILPGLDANESISPQKMDLKLTQGASNENLCNNQDKNRTSEGHDDEQRFIIDKFDHLKSDDVAVIQMNKELHLVSRPCLPNTKTQRDDQSPSLDGEALPSNGPILTLDSKRVRPTSLSTLVSSNSQSSSSEMEAQLAIDSKGCRGVMKQMSDGLSETVKLTPSFQESTNDMRTVGNDALDAQQGHIDDQSESIRLAERCADIRSSRLGSRRSRSEDLGKATSKIATSHGQPLMITMNDHEGREQELDVGLMKVKMASINQHNQQSSSMKDCDTNVSEQISNSKKIGARSDIKALNTFARDQDFVTQQHGSGVIPKARIKTIKMTLVIVVAYILCWSPFLILNLCGVFGLIKNDTNVSHALLTLTQSLAHLNSAVNPIIFWLFSSKRNNNNTNGNNANKNFTTQHQAIQQQQVRVAPSKTNVANTGHHKSSTTTAVVVSSTTNQSKNLAANQEGDGHEAKCCSLEAIQQCCTYFRWLLTCCDYSCCLSTLNFCLRMRPNEEAHDADNGGGRTRAHNRNRYVTTDSRMFDRTTSTTNSSSRHNKQRPIMP